MKGKINGIEFEAEEFFYDGCHKIYLVTNKASRKQMLENGWGENDIRPIEELPATWLTTCPLRFIYSADLLVSYVAQCQPAKFEGWDLPNDIVKELENMRREQLEANGE